VHFFGGRILDLSMVDRVATDEEERGEQGQTSDPVLHIPNLHRFRPVPAAGPTSHRTGAVYGLTAGRQTERCWPSAARGRLRPITGSTGGGRAFWMAEAAWDSDTPSPSARPAMGTGNIGCRRGSPRNPPGLAVEVDQGRAGRHDGPRSTSPVGVWGELSLESPCGYGDDFRVGAGKSG